MSVDGAADQNEQFARHTVPVGDAAQVAARIGMNVGTLRITGGATALADGAFRYTPGLEPVVAYEEAGHLGKLTICQRTPTATQHQRGRNEWDIALSATVPLDLAIAHSTGDSHFDLSGLSLTTLSLDRATGSTNLALRGDHQHLREMRVESATGSLDLDLTGRYATLSSLDVSGGTGELEADLRGSWERDVAVSLRVATGSVHVRLPEGIAIELRGSVALGRVRVAGLAAVAGGWRRDAPAGVPIMRLDISAGVGSVSIEANP